ncbi:hypothetical protein EXIGLDRAFT_97570 [Exidia glandulosa HHB12029]|uniref:CN hydrolase domain-containing protein n=1 Tax=Exidia glandulosa HHB12029 TaxID=1314781 RepID=A0A165H1Y0_EXIGL|nr:hypothetical protein EXIGLDRAFT_97570 [Exidia glandulosa HHB12029]
MAPESPTTLAVSQRRLYVVLPTALLLGYLALGSTPSFIPVVLVLAGLLDIAPRLDKRDLSVACLALSFGGTLARCGPAYTALETPGLSLLLSFAVVAAESGVASLVAVGATKLGRKSSSGWVRLCAFPALWTAWDSLAMTPLGRLGTWTPAQGYGAYAWTLPFMGAPAIDWVAASWAVVLASMLGRPASHPREQNLVDLGLQTNHSDESALLAANAPLGARPNAGPSRLTLALLALAVPSFFYTPATSTTPPPQASTMLTVACILPPKSAGVSDEMRYITESKHYLTTVDLIVWPEGAVRVQTKQEKERMLANVTKMIGIQSHPWVAVSYIEPAGPDAPEKQRNSLTVLNWKQELFTYHKRHLVPGKFLERARNAS